MTKNVFVRSLNCVGVFILTLVLQGSTRAESEDRRIEEMSLEELLNVKIVSATRQEESQFPLPSMITVLTSEQLNSWGAQNLADSLRIASGVMSRKNPGDFPQYLVAVRGNTADFLNTRTLFLIDGVPLKNPNGGLDPGWIPLAMIERVEIVKGPISSLYGANAFGGVINVITRSAKEGSSLEAAAGTRIRNDRVSDQFRLGHSVALNYGGKKGALGYFLSAQQFRDQDSPATYSGSAYQDVFGKFTYQVSESTVLSLQSLISLDRNEIASTSGTGPIRNDMHQVVLSGETKLGENSKLRLTGYNSGFNHYLNYTDGLIKYDNEADTYGFTSQYTTTFGKNHHFVAGAEYAYDSGRLETFERDYTAGFPFPINPVGWSPKTQNTYGFYIQDQYKGWNQFLPLVGLRYDRNSVYGDALSPRAGISYAIQENLSVYATAGRAFRAPVFNESYIRGFGKLGNTDLKPEFATTYEIGLKHITQSVQNTLSLFRENISQRIDVELLDPANPTGMSTYRNVGTAWIQGVELEGSMTLAPSVRPFYNATLLSTDDGNGGRIEKTINRKIVAGVNHPFGDWEIKYTIIHEGEQFFQNTNSQISSDALGRVWVPEVTTVNLQVTKKLSTWGSAEVFVNNLTNRQYKESFSDFIISNGSWMPGITIGTAVRAHF